MVDNNEILEQVLQLGQALNTFQLQTTASFNELRAEIKENKKEIQKSREIENAHWEENKRLWQQKYLPTPLPATSWISRLLQETFMKLL